MDKLQLANNIRKAREVKGVTQLEAAKALDITHNAYTKIERGITNLPFKRIIQIAEYYDVTVYDLLKGDEEPNVVELSEELVKIKKDLKLIKEKLARREK